MRPAGAGRRLGVVLTLGGALACALVRPASAAAHALPPAATAVAPPAYREIVAVVHLHSTVADGASSPLQLARAARAAGVDAIVMTDHFLERVPYAPWPLGDVLGVSLSRPSVVRYGLRRYLGDLRAAERAVPGLIVLPGLEVLPYARFTGSLLDGDLILHGSHRHMLIVGIEDPARLERLPVSGNRWGGVYRAGSFFYLLPLGALAWAIPRVRRTGDGVGLAGRAAARRPSRILGAWVLITLSLAVLYAGFPFRMERFSPVGADPGTAPYRLLIDTVRGWGGVSAWAHPEARAAIDTRWGVRMMRSPYPALVRDIPADEFGAIPEGTRRLIPPGGLWDQALLAGLEGARPGTPHAWAELDEHRPAAEIDFHLLQTVFLARGEGRAGLMEALRAGRHYARWTPRGRAPLRLPRWSLAAGDRIETAGGVLRATGPIRVILAVTGGDGPVRVRLVRGGEVIWQTTGRPPLEATLRDDPPRTTYYRLDVDGAYPYRLLSNPIVLRRPGGAA